MNRTNLWIDIGVFVGFLLAMNPVITGIPWHEWLSIALTAAIIAHLLLHWKWIVAVLLRFFQRIWHESRLKFVVDALLFVAFVVVMLTGLLISRSVLPLLGIPVFITPAWRGLHSFSAELGMWLVALHFALSWNWIVRAVSQYLLKPIQARLPSWKAGAAQVEEK